MGEGWLRWIVCSAILVVAYVVAGRLGMRREHLGPEELSVCGVAGTCTKLRAPVPESGRRGHPHLGPCDRKELRPMNFVFWILSALTVAGGLAAVLLKNLVHCALAVSVAFLGLALVVSATRRAVCGGFAQILVYIGAVTILVVFAILLIRAAPETPKGEGVFSRTWLAAGLAVAAAVFAVLGWAVLQSAGGVAA